MRLHSQASQVASPRDFSTSSPYHSGVKVSARDAVWYLCGSDDAEMLHRAGQETESANITMLANLASSYGNIRHMVFFPVDKHTLIPWAAASSGLLSNSTWRASASVIISINGLLKTVRAAPI